MTGCAAVGCSNSYAKGKILKVFPRDPARRKLWAIRTRRANWTPTDSSCLCEDHFDETQWEKTRVDGKRKLKWNAEPTVFSFRPPVKKRRILSYKNPKLNETKINIARIRTEHCYVSKDIAPLLPSVDKETENPNSTCFEGDILTPNQTEPYLVVKETTYPDHNEMQLENTNSTLTPNRTEPYTVVQGTKNPEHDERRIQMLEKFVRKHQLVIHRLQTKLKEVKRAHKKSFSSNVLQTFLNENQISSLSLKSTRGFQWTDETIQRALKLWHCCGTRGYEELLATQYPLPSLRTLRRKLEGLNSGKQVSVSNTELLSTEQNEGVLQEYIVMLDYNP